MVIGLSFLANSLLIFGEDTDTKTPQSGYAPLNLESVNNITVVSRIDCEIEIVEATEFSVQPLGIIKPYINLEDERNLVININNETKPTIEKLTIAVPTSNRIFSLTITSSSGGIDINVGNLRDLTIDTFSSDIKLKDCKIPNRVKIRNFYGDTTISTCTIGALNTWNISGDTTITDSTVSDVYAENSSGQIDFSTKTIYNNAEFINQIGNVSLKLPGGTGIRMDVDTIKGKIYCDFPFVQKENKKKTYVYESGLVLMKIKTTIGNAYIEPMGHINEMPEIYESPTPDGVQSSDGDEVSF
jgi:hypothetical protein